MKKKPLITCCALMLFSARAHAILSGGEFDLPEDRPLFRLDQAGAGSDFNFVGALSVSFSGLTYYGSAVALSPHWALSAGHNVDYNDDGKVDDGLSISLHIPGFGGYTAESAATHPRFGGFSNPDIFNDLSLLYFEDPLPDLKFPSLGLSMGMNDSLVLVGFGRSGFGNAGYTTNASLTDRRIGYNVVDSFEFQAIGSGVLFRYDFDDPNTFGTADGSLGNELETIIGPGDSGGPALVPYGDAFALVGTNTFTEGWGGVFGDIGGGVVMDPYWEWIFETTGLSAIPESSACTLLIPGVSFFAILFWRRRCKD